MDSGKTKKPANITNPEQTENEIMQKTIYPLEATLGKYGFGMKGQPTIDGSVRIARFALDRFEVGYALDIGMDGKPDSKANPVGKLDVSLYGKTKKPVTLSVDPYLNLDGDISKEVRRITDKQIDVALRRSVVEEPEAVQLFFDAGAIIGEIGLVEWRRTGPWIAYKHKSNVTADAGDGWEIADDLTEMAYVALIDYYGLDESVTNPMRLSQTPPAELESMPTSGGI